MTPSYTLLDLINICDNFHLDRTNHSSPFDNERLIPFSVSPSPTSPIIGLIRPAILTQLRSEIDRCRETQQPAVWSIQDSQPLVSFTPWISTPSHRTEAMKELCERWRDTGLFKDTIGQNKWRGELYPVYREPFGVHDKLYGVEVLDDKGNYAFEMERAAAALFGIVTYGVHMTIYRDSEDGMVIWVPTRARTKQTWVLLLVLFSTPLLGVPRIPEIHIFFAQSHLTSIFV